MFEAAIFDNPSFAGETCLLETPPTPGRLSVEQQPPLSRTTGRIEFLEAIAISQHLPGAEIQKQYDRNQPQH
jgi:hypothetical protein